MFIEMQIGNQLDEDDYLHFDYHDNHNEEKSICKRLL